MTSSGKEDFQVIPSWNGNPADWQAYKEEVRIWKLGCDWTVKYCVAVRLVAKLSGSARRAALELQDAALKGTEQYPQKGVANLMNKLAETLGGEAEVRKGESLEHFFGPITPGLKYCRRPGERIADWITRWDEGVRRMTEDGVKFLDQPDLAAPSSYEWPRCRQFDARWCSQRCLKGRTSICRLFVLR